MRLPVAGLIGSYNALQADRRKLLNHMKKPHRVYAPLTGLVGPSARGAATGHSQSKENDYDYGVPTFLRDGEEQEEGEEAGSEEEEGEDWEEGKTLVDNLKFLDAE